jgi:general secretion pathway protein G
MQAMETTTENNMSNRSRIMNRARRAAQAGVTLIEVIIVVAIMAMLAAGVTFAVIPKYRESQIKTAETNAFTIRQAVQSWQMTNNEYSCPSMADLVSGKHIDSAANIKDPWGEDYQLQCPESEVVVCSGGPDKKRGTSDDITVPKGAASSTGS